VPTSIWSFSSCSLNSSSLLILFVLFGSTAYEVSALNPRVMMMVTSDWFLNFRYFSLVIRSLKPFDSFLTNIRSFQSCLMFSITFKADWSLNHLENWDNPTILGTCYALKFPHNQSGCITDISGHSHQRHPSFLPITYQAICCSYVWGFPLHSLCGIPCNFTFYFSSLRSFHSSSLTISNDL